MSVTQWVLVQFMVWLVGVSVLFAGAVLESLALMGGGILLAVASAFVGAWGNVYGDDA